MDAQESNNKKQEKRSAPYYESRPEFGQQGPSKLKSVFGKSLTFFVVIVSGVLLYFVLLRISTITEVVAKIIDILTPILYGFVIAYLLNPIVKKVDHFMVPRLQKKIADDKARKLSRAM